MVLVKYLTISSAKIVRNLMDEVFLLNMLWYAHHAHIIFLNVPVLLKIEQLDTTVCYTHQQPFYE